MVVQKVPCYQPGSLNHVDPYFVQEHVVLLLVLTHSVIGRTSSSYWKGYYMKEDHRSYLTQLLQLRKEILKKFRLVRDSNPWPLRYRYSVLPIERFNGLLPVGLLAQLVARALHRYRRGPRVRISYKPEFFLDFFATAKVASISAMIFFHIILHPAVLIHMIFIYS